MWGSWLGTAFSAATAPWPRLPVSGRASLTGGAALVPTRAETSFTTLLVATLVTTVVPAGGALVPPLGWVGGPPEGPLGPLLAALVKVTMTCAPVSPGTMVTVALLPLTVTGTLAVMPDRV